MLKFARAVEAFRVARGVPWQTARSIQGLIRKVSENDLNDECDRNSKSNTQCYFEGPERGQVHFQI
jgi:hypothetical protein